MTKHESTPANDTLPVQSQRPRGPKSNNSQPLYHPVTGPLVGCPGYAWDPYQQTWIYTMPYGQPYSGPGWAPPKKAFQTLYPQVQGPADCTGQGWRTPQKNQGPSVLKPTTYYSYSHSNGTSPLIQPADCRCPSCADGLFVDI